MHDYWPTLLLPVLFIIHNCEETQNLDNSPLPFPRLVPAIFAKPTLFKIATTILSIAVCVLIWSNFFVDSTILEKVSVLTYLAIAINGVHHILFSAWSHTTLPGTYSARFLILPYSLFLAALSPSLQAALRAHFVLLLVEAGLLMIAAIYGSLFLAYILKRGFSIAVR